MYRYSAFCLTIDSELELPDLAQGNGDPDVIIRLGNVTPQDKRATIGSEIALPLNIGRFHIKEGREIVVDPSPNVDPVMLRSLLQGKLMAHLLRQRGCLPLHASGIAIGGQCVLFLGASGAGKSTTAAAFYARGHSVLTDDIAAVRLTAAGVQLQTSWSGLRLFNDARILIPHRAAKGILQHDKYVIPLERPVPAASFNVKRIYFLEFAATPDRLFVGTRLIPESSAVALLNSHSFLRSSRAGRDLLRINLGRAASIAAVVPVYSLIRPRSLTSLPELVDLVEKEIGDHE